MGIPAENEPALKGRHRLSRPYRAGFLSTRDPGRCPGLACLRAFGPPLIGARSKCMTGSSAPPDTPCHPLISPWMTADTRRPVFASADASPDIPRPLFASLDGLPDSHCRIFESSDGFDGYASSNLWMQRCAIGFALFQIPTQRCHAGYVASHFWTQRSAAGYSPSRLAIPISSAGYSAGRLARRWRGGAIKCGANAMPALCPGGTAEISRW